jgi:hypothetical protein
MQLSNMPNVWQPRTGMTPNPSLERSRRPAFTAEQNLFIQRLRNLVNQHRDSARRYTPDDWHRRLIDKALYSTYRDCLNLAVGSEAREILQLDEETAAVRGGSAPASG